MKGKISKPCSRRERKGTGTGAAPSLGERKKVSHARRDSVGAEIYPSL